MYIRLVIVLLLAMGFGITARAHEFWENHERVDPLTKTLCCGEADHFVLDESQVSQVASGWHIQGRFVMRSGISINIDQTIKNGQVQPSPDGHFHVNIWGSEVKCFFAPLAF